jgi:hypothetical protein
MIISHSFIIDDIIVKIKSRASLLDNLALVFDRLHSTRTKLNPDKFVFGVTVGKLLGFLVSHRRIEAKLEKIKMIEAMRPPTHIKNVQKLTKCLAMLNQFISRLTKWALPFFKLLRRSGPFVWTEEVEETFQELKRYLTSPPIMVAPKPGEPLLLYVAITTEAVSMVLVAEWPERLQWHAPKEDFTSGSGYQDLQPAEESRDKEPVGSQEQEAPTAPEPQVESRLPEATSGPDYQDLTLPRQVCVLPR